MYRGADIPVCIRVQTRSLSSLPRTLVRLISYSVAGNILVMVNSVTVLGTTELSSRPTKKEQKSLNTVHGTIYIGVPSSTWSGSTNGCKAQHSVGDKVHGLGMLELRDPVC